MDDIQLPADAEIRMLSAWADWIQSEYRKTETMVKWHDDELLLTGISICAILVMIGALAFDVYRIRRELDDYRT